MASKPRMRHLLHALHITLHTNGVSVGATGQHVDVGQLERLLWIAHHLKQLRKGAPVVAVVLCRMQPQPCQQL